MTRGYFVTGTDTGIGKTVVSLILTRGLNCLYWKPIQTGADEGTDSDFVADWTSSQQVWPETYVFRDPVSPHLASEIEDREIDLAHCLVEFRKLPAPVIVEGAGGVLVPINRKYLMIDLIQQLRVPAIVVASTRLGTINHSLLTLEALRARGVPILGFIMSGSENRPVQKTIETYGHVPCLGHVATCAGDFTASWLDTAFAELSVPPFQSESETCIAR